MKKSQLVLFSTVLLTACGGDDDQPNTINTQNVDPTLTCKTDFCGEARFLAAVPTRNTVSIKFGRNAQALADISPAFEATEDHVDEINETVESVFGIIEGIASEEPTQSEDNFHQWTGDQDGASYTLEISNDGDQTYDFALDFEDDVETSGVTGSVVLNEANEKESFEFQIDFSLLGDVGGDVSGAMVVRAIPTDDGVWEITYDLEAADGESEAFETTRYWVMGTDGGAIEYTIAGSSSTETAGGEIYVRWDDEGGRLDGLTTGEEDSIGAYEFVQSHCWDSVGGELFTAQALFSDTENYSDIDGEESDCQWELIDAHPDLEADIEAYFDDESWETYDEFDEIPDDFGGTNNENNLNNLNNENNLNNLNNENNISGECEDAATTLNDALFECDFEQEDPAMLCLDEPATIACADALLESEDVCFELENNPDCF